MRAVRVTCAASWGALSLIALLRPFRHLEKSLVSLHPHTIAKGACNISEHARGAKFSGKSDHFSREIVAGVLFSTRLRQEKFLAR